MIAGHVDVLQHLVLQESEIENHVGLLARRTQDGRPARRLDRVAMTVEMPALGSVRGDAMAGVDADAARDCEGHRSPLGAPWPEQQKTALLRGRLFSNWLREPTTTYTELD